MTAVQDKLLSSSNNTTPRLELGRLCREICLAAEQHPLENATALDEKLDAAVAEVRGKFGETSVTDAELLEIFQIEQNRVADARVLAELLAPRLAAHLQRTGSSVSVAAVPNSMRNPEPADRPTPVPAPAAAPAGIADFIDGMLDLERKDPRKRSSSSRK